MLVSDLVRLYDKRQLGQWRPRLYVNKPVHWRVLLDSSGQPYGVQDLGGSGRLRPYKPRTSNVAPMPIDNSKYVLGPGSLLPGLESHKHHTAYVGLMDQLADDLPNELTVQAIRSFLHTDIHRALQPLVDITKWGTARPKYKPLDQVVEFVVDGDNPIDSPVVADWWYDYCYNHATSKLGTCNVCGTSDVPLPRLWLQATMHVPALHGGAPQDSLALVSLNQKAYEHWGQGPTSQMSTPTCFTCMAKTADALAILVEDIKQDHSRLWGDVRWVWWSSGDEISVEDLLDAAQESDIAQVVESAFSGRSYEMLANDSLHMIGLVSNGSRISVVSWSDVSLVSLRRNVERWLTGLSIAGPGGTKPYAPSFSEVIRAATAGPTMDSASDNARLTATKLLESAILGRPLPMNMLNSILTYSRRRDASNRLSHPQAALIQYLLQRLKGSEPLNNSVSYQCGALLALLDSIQYRAHGGKVNTTLIDRFYASASTSPGSALPTLLRDTQGHLGTLRKNPRLARLGVYFERQLVEIMADISSFPMSLTLQQQGEFALGYYHAKARVIVQTPVVTDTDFTADTDTLIEETV